MALRIAPSSSHPTATSNLPSDELSAPSVPGLADPLRSKLASSKPTAPSSAYSAQPDSTHALEARLLHWRRTQEALKMEGLRRTFGIAEPVRRGMELSMVRAGEWRGQALGGSAGVSGDILEGRDTTCDWDDIFVGDQADAPADLHSEMEQRLRMRW